MWHSQTQIKFTIHTAADPNVFKEKMKVIYNRNSLIMN